DYPAKIRGTHPDRSGIALSRTAPPRAARLVELGLEDFRKKPTGQVLPPDGGGKAAIGSRAVQMEAPVEGDPSGHASGKRVAMRLYLRLKAILERRRLEQDLQDEISSHLAMDMQERITRGESQENSYYGARKDFGSVVRSKESVRETWGLGVLDRFL